MKEGSINLISPQTNVPGDVSRVLESLQRVSSISLVVFLVVSVAIGSIYLVMRASFESSRTRRDQLRSQVSALADTEALLVALRGRLKVADKILTSQVSWGQAIGRITQLVPSPKLSSVAVDEKHRVVLTIQTSSLEDNFPILTALVADVEAKRILSPEIVSFQLDKDGISHLAISYYPVLSL